MDNKSSSNTGDNKTFVTTKTIAPLKKQSQPVPKQKIVTNKPTPQTSVTSIPTSKTSVTSFENQSLKSNVSGENNSELSSNKLWSKRSRSNSAADR